MAVVRPDPRDDSDDDSHGAVDRVGADPDVPADHITIVGDAPDTETMYAEAATDRPGWHVRLFGSHEFFRLWLILVVSSTGDWLGFSAIILLAADIGGGAGAGAGAGAISLVMAARIVPGFFFGPVAGVLVDRWDRKKVMVRCDLGRAAVLATLPFVDNIAGLVLASLALEVLTLLWGPAKDSEVPNLVPHDHLTTANSLSLAAAYGTFPFASLLFALLAGVSVWVGSIPGLGWLENDQMSLAFLVDVCTFLFSAWMLHRLVLVRRPEHIEGAEPGGTAGFRATIEELREGWREVLSNHTVRAVNIGIATGLIGGGMLIPLGAVFSTEVLDAGAAGYGLFTTALGFGVALGVIGVSTLQKRLPKRTVFVGALFLAGASLFSAASSSTLPMAVIFVGLMGVSVGPIYVIGFVLLQQEVDDELRGRVFSSLNTLVRLCVLVSMVVGPLLAAVLGKVSTALVEQRLDLAGGTIALPGVRLALWLAALIIFGAGFAALAALRAGQREQSGHVATPLSRKLMNPDLTEPEPRPPRHRGRFIAFEGGEACGKSTQAALLAAALGAVLTREPGGTAIGARLRELLLDPATVGLSPRAEALLMGADRAQHVAEVVEPALAAGGHVVTDRFAGSSVAYQGYGRGLPVEEIEQLSRWAAAGTWPDLVVLLDVAPSLTVARLGAGRDRMEAEPPEFHAAVRDRFLTQAAADPARWSVVDGQGSIDEVAAAVRDLVRERLQLAL